MVKRKAKKKKTKRQKTKKQKQPQKTAKSKDTKRLFKCNRCGKTYEKVAWYEKHVRKCKKKPVPVKAGSEGSGRNPDGSFAEGNNHGKGNPHWSKLRRYREDYLKQFRQIFTPEMMNNVTLVMIYKAVNEKDLTAAKTLLEYAMGKPVARIEDELEGGPERKAVQIAEALKALEMDENE